MKILAVDTATEACSVALLVDNKKVGLFEICPQKHSQRVLPMIDEVLKQHNIKLSQLDAIAYGRGPGSFTGVRIAAGIVQGLAYGASLPVIEVSTLAAMAQETFDRTGVQNVRVLIDARMGEVYFGDYCVQEEDKDGTTKGLVSQAQTEAVLPPEQVLAKFSQIGDDNWQAAGTGWQAYQQILGVTDEVLVKYPNAIAMLALAQRAFHNGESISADKVHPTYVRDTVTWKKLPGRE